MLWEFKQLTKVMFVLDHENCRFFRIFKNSVHAIICFRTSRKKKFLQVAFTAFCHRKVLDWIKQSVWSTYYDCLIFNRNDLSHTVPGKQWKKNMPRLGVLNVFDWARWLCYRAFDATYHFLCELIFKSIRFAFCAYRTMWIWELMNRPPKNSTPPCKYFGGFLKHDGFRWNIMWAKE